MPYVPSGGPIVEGFSLSHAEILPTPSGLVHPDPAVGMGEAEAGWGDIYGIRSGRIAVNTGNFDNTGDDAVLSSWFWFNYADVEISSGYVPFATISKLAGSTVTSSGTAPDDTYSMPLWNEKSNNTPTHPMRIRVPSKTKDGIVRSLEFVLFKVQFHPFSFDGPDYKAGLLLHYAGRALISDQDEVGNILADRAIGRMTSGPVA